MQITGIDIRTKCSFQRRESINHGAVSQAARRLNTIGVLNLNPKVYARFLSVLASRCQVFAGRLAELGLPKDVTPDILVRRYGSVFTPKGLARKSTLRISKACMKAGLNPEQTTLFGFLRHEGVQKPSILGILQAANENGSKAKNASIKRAEKSVETLSPKALAFNEAMKAEAQRFREKDIAYIESCKAQGLPLPAWADAITQSI